MIDIVYNKNLVKFDNEFGFSKIYSLDDIKAIEGKDEKSIRKFLENKNNDLLFGIEKFGLKDKIKQKDSGLNQVLCKLAKKNEIKIGFSFSDLLNADDEKRAIILGRMVQNVILCNKYGVDMIIGSFAKNKYEMRSPNDLIAFGRLLGMRKIWNEKIDNFFKEENIGIIRIK